MGQMDHPCLIELKDTANGQELLEKTLIMEM